MSIKLCVIASGSTGNCTVVRTPTGVFLIDCGIGPRLAAGRLKGTGVRVDDISAVCLTHLDRDHFNPNWASTIARQNVRVFCPADRVNDVIRLADNSAFAKLVQPFDGAAFEVIDGVQMHSMRLAHDGAGSHAFFIDGFNTRIGYATDLGVVPVELIERFCGVDLLAIESNYDPDMQRTSGRPWFLQQRITGGSGHLSNAQALAAVRAVLDRCQYIGTRLPQHVVLLHRSQQCNCPKLVRALFSQDARIARRLVLSEQDQRTDWLGVTDELFVGEQLVWGWG
jgi:phosphoribosyl 1,2-cyclic phosphodiesterase